MARMSEPSILVAFCQIYKLPELCNLTSFSLKTGVWSGSISKHSKLDFGLVTLS